MKRHSPLFVVLSLAIILGLGLGCAKRPDDSKISSEIQDKFSQDSGLGTKQLAVKADGGVVTLSGTVDTDVQREAAGRQAASVAGVTTVINNLQVSNVGKPSAVAEMTPHEATLPTSTASSVPRDSTKPTKTTKSSRSRAGSAANNAKGDSTNTMDAGQDAPPPTSNDAPASTADSQPAVQTPTPPPAPKKLIIDQGTQLTVRLIDPIDSEKNITGDTFHTTLNAPLTTDGEEAVPAGVELTGHLVEVKSAGKFAGQSEVILQLDSLSVAGQTYSVQTDQYKKEGSSRGKNTAAKVGGGAVLGSIIGAIAGGGKGAAIGAAAGAGAGGAVQAATKSQQIKLPSETVLNFTLQQPITVVQATPVDGNRSKLPDQK